MAAGGVSLRYWLVLRPVSGFGSPIGCEMKCYAAANRKIWFTCTDMKLETSEDKKWEKLFQISQTDQVAVGFVVLQDGVQIRYNMGPKRPLLKNYAVDLKAKQEPRIYFSETAVFAVRFEEFMPADLIQPKMLRGPRLIYKDLTTDGIQLRTIYNVQLAYIDPAWHEQLKRILENEKIASAFYRHKGTEVNSTEVAEYMEHMRRLQILQRNPEMYLPPGARDVPDTTRPYWLVADYVNLEVPNMY